MYMNIYIYMCVYMFTHRDCISTYINMIYIKHTNNTCIRVHNHPCSARNTFCALALANSGGRGTTTWTLLVAHFRMLHRSCWTKTIPPSAILYSKLFLRVLDSRPSPRAFGQASLGANLIWRSLSVLRLEGGLHHLGPFRGHFPRRIPGGSQVGP